MINKTNSILYYMRDVTFWYEKKKKKVHLKIIAEIQSGGWDLIFLWHAYSYSRRDKTHWVRIPYKAVPES